jgi:hypothetical protein
MQMPRPAQLGVIIVPGIRGRWRKSIRLLTRTRRNYRACEYPVADVQMRRATPNCKWKNATSCCEYPVADVQMRRATPNCSGRTPHRAANTRLADMQMPRPAHGECSRVNQCGNARGQAQGTAAPHGPKPTSKQGQRCRQSMCLTSRLDYSYGRSKSDCIVG